MNATLEENTTTNEQAANKGDAPSKYIAYNREGVALGEIWAADYDEAFNAAAQQYDAMTAVRIEGAPAPAPTTTEPAGVTVAASSEKAEEQIPKVGKGGPLAWFKRMAMLNGDHPRILARSKAVLEKAGIDPAEITEAVLKEAVKLCLPAAKTWADRQKKAGQVVDINDQAWYAVGQPKASQTGAAKKAEPKAEEKEKVLRFPKREALTQADNAKTPKRQKVLKYLAGRKATTSSAAVPAEDVYKNAGGTAVVAAMIFTGHIARTVGEEKGGLYLTKEGLNAIEK